MTQGKEGPQEAKPKQIQIPQEHNLKQGQTSEKSIAVSKMPNHCMRNSKLRNSWEELESNSF